MDTDKNVPVCLSAFVRPAAVVRLLRFQREADLEGDLIVPDLAVLDVAARFNDLKPIHVSNRLARKFDGRIDRILDAGWRGADDFKNLVDVVAHGDPPG